MEVVILPVCLLAAGLLGYLLSLKKQMRRMTDELKRSRQMSYNKQLGVQLFDKDLNELAKEINRNLDFQAECKKKARRQEETVKRAVSDIAHDLRTPLTVVKGNLQLMDREGTLGEKERGYLRICENKTDELKGMADAFFELSLLESDVAEPELEAVEITKLLFQMVLEQEGLIQEHQLTPRLDIPEKTILIRGNRQLLERMFYNLFHNTLKYAESTFAIQLKRVGQVCEVTFSNPIADSSTIDITHIFDRAYKADMSRHRQGAGLGLYIVKLLAQKQGAAAEAAVKAGELCITIKLPLFSVT